MAPPSSGAWASVSGGRGAPAWVLLDREPRVADLDPAGTGSEADVVLHLVPPPGVCTAFVDRALHPDPDPDDAWDDDTAPCRIQGADASGRLLFAFPTPRAPGDSHLVVCRPVASSDHHTATGKASPLPAFPEQALGFALSAAAPAGIIFDPEAKSGDGFFVAQLQTKPSSASTPVVAAALFFSSDANNWAVTEVPGEDRWHGFRASSVVSHDRAVHGDAARLVFVDLSRRGLLLFHPRRLTATRFIDLPECGGGEAIDQGQATVDSTEGKLVYVLFEEVPEGMLVRFWCLSEDEGRWTSHLSSDQVFGRDARVWPLGGRPRLGPVDPNTLTRIVFGIRCAGGGMSSFCIDVTPEEMSLRRVSSACVDSVVCHLQPAPKSMWMEAVNSVVEDGKHAGMLALGAVQKGRKYADSLPGVVQLVGATLSLPHTGAALTAAKAIKTVNDTFTISENISSWFWQHRPGAPGLLGRVVGSMQEAEQALQEWIKLNKPTNMVVDPAPGELTDEEWDHIRSFLTEKGAYTLVQHYDYEMVPRPPC